MSEGKYDTTRATLWGLGAAVTVIAGIYFGSRRFKDFDPALISYAGATVFAAFGIGYRYTMWLRRPPTRLYWRRSWQLFFSPRRLGPNIARLATLLWTNFVEQRFIHKRSHLRWAAHWFIFWGCVSAAMVTFPLSFGWIRFETAPSSQQVYQAYVFGIRAFSFELANPVSFLIFNVLDVSAILVLAGIFFSLLRRGRDRGALAVQQFERDLLPITLLFAVSVTGLLLTASTHFLRGYHYGFLSQFHAITVIFTLLYLPFGKFFHIFQRPAQIGVEFYRQAGERQGMSSCDCCGTPHASTMHIDDLKQIQAQLGINYELGSGRHYQNICPQCRRKNLALIQDTMWRRARGGEEYTRT
ncbi:MAG TPA: MFS transporter [Blastocatellia bacterium]|nr:MFS transporter [Blastocatellia bacterium]